MVAALVLFNGLSALRALLGVGHDPGYILALIRVLGLPSLRGGAVARSVRFVATAEAEHVSAFAAHICCSHVQVLHAVVAALVGAPAHILIIIGEGLAVPLEVGNDVVPREIFQEEGVEDCDIASVLGALRKNGLCSVSHFLSQILLPTTFAELVSTLQLLNRRVSSGSEL